MKTNTNGASIDHKVPVTHHIVELRRSLMICVVTLVAAAIGAFVLFDPLLELFQKPLDQTLYYTSPAGGLTFVFKLCIVVGLIAAIPVFVNRVFSFAKPAVPQTFHKSFAWYSLFSVLLALTGVAFAYIVSLPAALEFLTNFDSGDIEAIITVDSYFAFFSTYLIGYAILFQTPIIMLFINKIRPFKPSSAMKYQRHIIVGSYIFAAILTPTPDPWNQTLMAVPVILLYQTGILLTWIVNRRPAIVETEAFVVPDVQNEQAKIKTLISRPLINEFVNIPVQETEAEDQEDMPKRELSRPPIKVFDIIAPRQLS